MTGGKAAKGDIPREEEMALVRCRWVHRIMGRRRDERPEGRKAMWMVDGRLRSEWIGESDSVCSSSAVGAVVSRS